MATADERNFRSSYYEKVGFRNVEEKKSLEILLKEKSLDKSKLNHFCLRFPVPGIHRSYLWKLLLGVLPLQVACHDYVWSCREQSFNDLARQMVVLKLDTKSASHNFVVMWLLETGGVPTGCKNPLKRKPIYENFAKLAAMMMEFFDNDVEVYWVSKAFFNFLTRLAIELPKLAECTHSLLEKEDPDLYNHMIDKELLSNLPYFDWFTSMFSVVLNEASLCKIWDKMVGGSYKILIFVAVSLCLTMKKSILASDTLDNLLTVFENVSEEASESIVTKALDLWQQHSNSVNIGLEFSIKHNPTALWAAQQTFSMPNLPGGNVTTGLLERPATVPSNLHICSNQTDQLDGCLSLGNSETDAGLLKPHTIPFGPPPTPLSTSTSSLAVCRTSSYELQTSVFVHHLNEMTKALNDLSQSSMSADSAGDVDKRQKRESGFLDDYDEPWMKPSRPVGIKSKSVAIQADVDIIVPCKFQEVAVDVEKGKQLEMEEMLPPSRNIFLKVLLMLGLNGMVAAAVIFCWLVFLT